MKWPANRTFVDSQDKVNDPWFGGMKKLEPLLKLSVEDFATLQEIIQAYRDATENPDDDEDLFNLPIDESPLFSEDFLISWETARSEARRVAMSRFAGAPVLISTTTLSGLSTVGIDIPAGYTHAELVVKGMSLALNTFSNIAYSEDGGSTFLTQVYNIYNTATSTSASVAGDAPWDIIAFAAAAVRYGRSTIYNYASGENKFVLGHFLGTSDNIAWTEQRILTSAAPINRVRFTPVLTTFDAGTIELWATP